MANYGRSSDSSSRDCLLVRHLFALSRDQEIHLREEFGSHLSDGAEAYRFRIASIDPYLALDSCERLVLDFTGVRAANSSFANALVSGLLEEHGEAALRQLVFRGCLPAIQVLVQSAGELGLTKYGERVSA